MRVHAQIEIAASRAAVWEFVVDPERYLHFMAGMTRWEVAGERATGLGARYRTLMRVGSAEIGGLVEVVAAPTVRGHLRSSLQQLKRQVEHEQLRRQAAARRSRRGVSASSASTAGGRSGSAGPRQANGN